MSIARNFPLRPSEVAVMRTTFISLTVAEEILIARAAALDGQDPQMWAERALVAAAQARLSETGARARPARTLASCWRSGQSSSAE
jgi:hypothetical protein